jgi:hypothetical protein
MDYGAQLYLAKNLAAHKHTHVLGHERQRRQRCLPVSGDDSPIIAKPPLPS